MKIDKLSNNPETVINYSISEIKVFMIHCSGRAKSLSKKIEDDGYWKYPIIIDPNISFVIDGHHRLEAAKYLGLYEIPCIAIPYDDNRLEYVLWNGGERVNSELIIHSVKSGKLMPFKSVKCIFKPVLTYQHMSIDQFRNRS